MKKKYGFVLIALILFSFASNGSATVISDPWNPLNSSDEQNVYEVYNYLYGTTYTNSNQLTQVSDSLDNLWMETNGQVLLEVRYAGFSQEFGYFYNGSYTSLISSISNGYNYMQQYINAPNGGPFAWVDETSGGTWYSNDLLNIDNKDHFIAFTTLLAGEYILAFEDWPNTLGDKDYNDLIVKVTCVKPVPEPSTFVLLGAGLAGVGLLRRRFKK